MLFRHNSNETSKRRCASSCTNELKIPDYIKTEILDKKQIEYTEIKDLEEIIDKLDILYMTRVQKERFSNEEEYNNLKDCYILNKEKMQKAKKDLCVLHPLPRVNEISVEVDEDSRACYFKQVECGRYIRMALILKLLGIDAIKNNEKIENDNKETTKQLINKFKCKNPNCITSVERGINQICYLTNDIYRCKYYDEKVN